MLMVSHKYKIITINLANKLVNFHINIYKFQGLLKDMVKLSPSEAAKGFSLDARFINPGFLPDSFEGNKKNQLDAGSKTRRRFL